MAAATQQMGLQNPPGLKIAEIMGSPICFYLLLSLQNLILSPLLAPFQALICG